MGRFRLGALILALATPAPAAADLLPPDQQAIPRRLQILDVQRFDAIVFVLQPCSPQGAPMLDYCVLQDDAPTRAAGKLFGLRKRGTRTRPVAVDAGMTPPSRITTPVLPALETGDFFAKDTRVIRSDANFEASTSVVVPRSAGLESVTEVHRVVAATGDGISVVPVKVVWKCRSGQLIVRAPPPPDDGGADAGRERDVPSCTPARERISAAPATSARPPPEITPGAMLKQLPRRALLATVITLFVLGGALWFWRRRPRE
jgi:hypothetical protein